MSSHNYSVIKLSHCPSRDGAKHSLTIETLRQTNTRTVEPDAICCLSPLLSFKTKNAPRHPSALTGHRMCEPVVTSHGQHPELEMRERSWWHSGSGINHSGLRARNVGQVSRPGQLISSLARTLIPFRRGMSRTLGVMRIRSSDTLSWLYRIKTEPKAVFCRGPGRGDDNVAGLCH